MAPKLTFRTRLADATFLTSDRADSPGVPRQTSMTAPVWRRNHPVLALASIVTLFLASGSGIAISILIKLQEQQQTERPVDLNVPSQLLLFVASCVSVIHVLLHLVCARRGYARPTEGATHEHSNTIYGLTLLLARLGVPAWIAAMVITTLHLFKAHGKIELAEGVAGNVVWVDVAVAGLAFVGTLGALLVVESSHSPYATALVSSQEYIGSHGNGGKDAPEDNVWFGFQVSRPDSETRVTQERQSRREEKLPCAKPTGILGPAKTAWRQSHRFSRIDAGDRSRSLLAEAQPPGGTESQLSEDDSASSLGSDHSDSLRYSPLIMSFPTAASCRSPHWHVSPALKSEGPSAPTAPRVAVLKEWPDRGMGDGQNRPGLERTVTNFSRKRVQTAVPPDVNSLVYERARAPD